MNKIETTLIKKLTSWSVMLNSPDFKNTDAEMVRNEINDYIAEIMYYESRLFGEDPISTKNEVQTNCPLGETAPDFDTHSQIKKEIDKDYGK